MRKRTAFLAIIMFLSINASSQKKNITDLQRVKISGENLYISAKADSVTDICYLFRKCMFNKLFTFYSVTFVPNNDRQPLPAQYEGSGDILNLAYSDNIGPFYISGGGWCGGNHSYKGEREKETAKNIKYNIYLNDREVRGDTSALVGKIDIKVTNIIYNPSPDTRDQISGDILCHEYVTYNIRRNNIEVTVRHKYDNEIPAVIKKYYGMQSMFENETEIMTPKGKYRDWTPVSEVSRFKKGEYPYFRRFIEKRGNAYQSSFLLNEGLGKHNEISDNDIIFIGNSYKKSYHTLIFDAKRKKGDTDYWKGVYTWFPKAIKDNAEILCYGGIVNDREVIFIDCKKKSNTILVLPDEYNKRRFSILQKDKGIKIHPEWKNNSINIISADCGSCIIIFK
ncbi:MAG: hypothetical protein LKI53_08040 [Bacteroidales bacterium]|jgi:hypothetical protein|nr:hypothetical protein [Bacteroidales bacterium]